MRNEDVLIVAIDIDPSGRDKPLMMIQRNENGKIKILNLLDKEDEVIGIYKKTFRRIIYEIK